MLNQPRSLPSSPPELTSTPRRCAVASRRGCSSTASVRQPSPGCEGAGTAPCCTACGRGTTRAKRCACADDRVKRSSKPEHVCSPRPVEIDEEGRDRCHAPGLLCAPPTLARLARPARVARESHSLFLSNSSGTAVLCPHHTIPYHLIPMTTPLAVWRHSSVLCKGTVAAATPGAHPGIINCLHTDPHMITHSHVHVKTGPAGATWQRTHRAAPEGVERQEENQGQEQCSCVGRESHCARC